MQQCDAVIERKLKTEHGKAGLDNRSVLILCSKSRQCRPWFNDNPRRRLISVIAGIDDILVVDVGGKTVVGDVILGIKCVAGRLQHTAIGGVFVRRCAVDYQQLILVAGMIDGADRASAVEGQLIDRLDRRSGQPHIGGQREAAFLRMTEQLAAKCVHRFTQSRRAPCVDHQLTAHAGHNVIAVGNPLQRGGRFGIVGRAH